MKPAPHPDKPIWSDVLGWCGIALVLSAYALASLGYISTRNPLFQLANIAGSVFVVIEAAYAHDRQVVVLNVIWAAIGFFALLHSFI